MNMERLIFRIICYVIGTSAAIYYLVTDPIGILATSFILGAIFYATYSIARWSNGARKSTTKNAL